ncbi:unnamed protein product, partial [Mesorhabditis belari]|uniref:LITAF domain-containing protein n=1 Tax=Mesorhabditis belari TaxID=2138241 RepID=A0AAF3FL10_9BILA
MENAEDQPPPYPVNPSGPQPESRGNAVAPIYVVGQQQPAVIFQQPIPIDPRSLGPYPTVVTCPNCKQVNPTTTFAEPGLLTWLVCCGTAIIGLWPCCLLPFCVDSCQDSEHRCGKCKKYIGTYKRI